MNQPVSPEMKDNQALSNRHAQCILAQVETLSSEHLGMYLHEVKWILEQLGTIMPDPELPYPEVYQQASRMVAQVDAMQEALTLERARRAWVSLQTMIAGPDTVAHTPGGNTEQ